MSAAGNHFCFSVTECLRPKIIFVFPSQSASGRKSFLFFHPRVSAAENHFCFSVPECLRPKIIFVFPSQSVCGQKSFLFFHPRVSVAGNHFCFSIPECQRPNCKIVFASAGLRDTPFIYMLKPQTHRGGIFIARIGYITAPLVTQTEGENLAAPNAA